MANRSFVSRNLGTIFVAPTLIFITLVGLYPLLYSLMLSFTGYKLTDPATYGVQVGFSNYLSVLSDPQFWNSTTLTLAFAACSVGVSLALAIPLALLMSLDLLGFRVVRTVILIPMILTPIAVGIIWRIMMMPDLGVLNYFVSLLGWPPLPWAGSRNSAFACLLLIDVWQWTPFMFIIILAGLKSLPASPLEAAAIDGASLLQTFVYVRLPMLKSTIVIAVMLRMIDALRTYDSVFLITRGGPDFATDFYSVYLQRLNFKFFDLGYGAAASWIVMIVTLVVVIAIGKAFGFFSIVKEREAL